MELYTCHFNIASCASRSIFPLAISGFRQCAKKFYDNLIGISLIPLQAPQGAYLYWKRWPPSRLLLLRSWAQAGLKKGRPLSPGRGHRGHGTKYEIRCFFLHFWLGDPYHGRFLV